MANARRRTQRTNRTVSRNMAAGSANAVAAMDSEEVRNARSMNWQNELKYINGDLRHLLVISAALFILLFAVGFFL